MATKKAAPKTKNTVEVINAENSMVPKIQPLDWRRRRSRPMPGRCPSASPLASDASPGISASASMTAVTSGTGRRLLDRVGERAGRVQVAGELGAVDLHRRGLLDP